MRKVLEMFKKMENKFPKTCKVYDKINVVIEFILSILLTWSMYKVIYVKHYVGFWSKPYLAVGGLVVLFMLAVIIINVVKYREKPEKLFLTFVIPIGIMYMFFILPYHVPDEPPHYIRAYETYHGEFIASINEEGKHRSDVAKNMLNLNLGNLNNYHNLMSHIENEEGKNYTEKIEAYGDAQSYPGILYLASGLGMKIGEALHFNIIITMYLARVCNFIVFLLFAYWAIKIIPFGKLVLSAYLMMPMMLQQAASVSPDAIINPVCIFFIAYLIKLAFQEKDLSKRNIAIVLALSIFTAIAKVVYFPIIFLLFLLIPNKYIDKKKKIILIIASIVLTVSIGGAWYVFQGKYIDEREYLQARNINPTEQLKHIIQNPLQYVQTLRNIIELKGMEYLYELIGNRLGWLNIELAESTMLIYILLLFVAAWLENHKVAFNMRQRIWTLLIVFCVVLLVYTALYLSWTEVGMNLVIGIQGRYFIPIAILGLLCLCMKQNYVKIKGINIIYMLFISGINLCAINTIIHHFMM